MHFKDVDRIPRFELYGFWPETIYRWYKESLPIGANLIDYFGLDKKVIFFANSEPLPNFITKTIEETDRYIIKHDVLGRVTKDLKTNVSMPTFIEYPVKNREDWEEMKKRYNPYDLRRHPNPALVVPGEDNRYIFNNEYYNILEDTVVILAVTGLFWKARDFLGTHRLLSFFYKKPGLIHEIIDFYTDFLIEMIKPIVNEAKFDIFFLAEDMAYKNGPHIGPNLFEEFMVSNYKKINGFLRSKGIDIIMFESDGNINELIPLCLKSGFNLIAPLEVAAGMDALELREKYGKKLLMIGNIDKRVVGKDKKSIEKEVTKKIHLTDEGGFIPGIDHLIPPSISLQNFKYYNKLVKSYIP
jgi:uroporphyrinogen decarboxylase